MQSSHNFKNETENFKEISYFISLEHPKKIHIFLLLEYIVRKDLEELQSKVLNPKHHPITGVYWKLK